MRPLGGKEFGYKGSGLCMLVDLDNVIGGGSVKKIPTMREKPLSRVSQTFEAWRIDQFYDQEESLSKLIASIKDIKKSGGEKMLLPGEREAISKLDAEKKGIPYEKSQWETLTKLSKLTGAIVPILAEILLSYIFICNLQSNIFKINIKYNLSFVTISIISYFNKLPIIF